VHTPPRLSLTTLDTAGLAAAGSGDAVVGPAVDPRAARVGQVHLGVGAFHRSHQAVFTEDAAAAAGEERWGILGVTQRSPRVVSQLRPQDGLYSVLTKGRARSSLRVIGSMRQVAFLQEESAAVLAAIASPEVTIVSSTVSEKGYRRAPGGGPDLDDADLAHDLAVVAAELEGPSSDRDAPTRTPMGALVRGLARRFVADAGPLTFVCCDNMPDNGQVVAELVHGALDHVGGPGAERLRAWVHESVAFPSTMVDRITPATTPAHREQAEAMLGLRDEGLVVAEPFSQWVVEDTFAAARPRWELAGVTFTSDVAPWERAKLRMLNGAHSAIAYLGALRGFRMIDEAVSDDEIAAAVRQMMTEEVIPTLTAPDGLDLVAYGEEILERFANPATGYTTWQVAGDGSQKLPIRILGTVADRLAAGVVPTVATRAMAAWIVFAARGRDAHGTELPLDDPLAARLREAAAGPEPSLADRMLALREVFPPEVADHPAFRTTLRTEVATLLTSTPTPTTR